MLLILMLLILISTICFWQIIIMLKTIQLKKVEEKDLINQIENIENCIDIKNKNKRTFNENIKLSEYCIDNFGTIK